MSLQGEERTKALQTIPKWGEVEGRDAVTRTYMFKGCSHYTLHYQFF